MIIVGYKGTTNVLVRDWTEKGGFAWVANPEPKDVARFDDEAKALAAFAATRVGSAAAAVLIPVGKGAR